MGIRAIMSFLKSILGVKTLNVWEAKKMGPKGSGKKAEDNFPD